MFQLSWGRRSGWDLVFNRRFGLDSQMGKPLFYSKKTERWDCRQWVPWVFYFVSYIPGMELKEQATWGHWCIHAGWVPSVMSNSLWSYGLQSSRLLCPWDSPGKNTGVGVHALLQEIFLAKGSNPCLLCLLHWLADNLPLGPPGKSGNTNESESHSVVSNSLWPHGLYSLWNTPCQNTGVGSRSLLQGIFPIQESDPGLLHCRWILYQFSHKGTLIGTTKNKPFTKILLSLTKYQGSVDSWLRQKATDNNFSTIMKHNRRNHGPTSIHANKNKVRDLPLSGCNKALLLQPGCYIIGRYSRRPGRKSGLSWLINSNEATPTLVSVKLKLPSLSKSNSPPMLDVIGGQVLNLNFYPLCK